MFGILGALAAFFISNRSQMGRLGRHTLTGLLALAAINLAVGFIIPNIDNFAHIGGFAGGILLGMAYSPRYRPVYDLLGRPLRLRDANSLFLRVSVLPLAVAVLVSGVFIGNRIVGDTPITYIREAEKRQEEGEFGLALNLVGEALDLQPRYGPAYLRRALIMAELGNVDYAMQDLGQAIRLGLSDSDRSRAMGLLLELRANP